MDLSDTSSWLPLDGLAAGFDANKAAPTPDLAGRHVALGTESYTFGDDTVQWRGPDGTGTDRYEAFDVDDGLYYVQICEPAQRRRAVSLVLDLAAGRYLHVASRIGEPAPGRTRVRQDFTVGAIDGTTARGPLPAPSTSLVGRRAMWIYSEQHAYEHVYLSPHWYTWQCLAGPERGLADTDEQTTYELRPGIFLFAWREKVVPCAAVTVADHRDARALRSHGALFGLDATEATPVHFTFGAHGRLLSTTVHPAELDPAVAG